MNRKDPRMLKPYLMVQKPNLKGFNSTKVSIKSKTGGKVLAATLCKSNVNTRRINAETMRHKLAQAQFVPFPRLVISPTERLMALTTDHSHNG